MDSRLFPRSFVCLFDAPFKSGEVRMQLVQPLRAHDSRMCPVFGGYQALTIASRPLERRPLACFNCDRISMRTS